MTFKETVQDLIKEANDLHQRERLITLRSVWIVGRLEELRVRIIWGLSADDFAKRIGLTKNIFWKRAQAARVMQCFPATKGMVERGELDVSSVALLSPKLTEANHDMLLEAVKHKSKREIEAICSRVTVDGQWIEREGEAELRVTLSETEWKLLERAREILAHGGKVPQLKDVLTRAIEELVERRDPRRQAERWAARQAKEAAAEVGEKAEVDSLDSPSPGKHQASQGCARPAIPAAVRHQVMMRDQGRCTWVEADGARCLEQFMLEYDHLIPWRNGGRHSVENLALRCRRHNQHRAEQELGRALRDSPTG